MGRQAEHRRPIGPGHRQGPAGGGRDPGAAGGRGCRPGRKRPRANPAPGARDEARRARGGRGLSSAPGQHHPHPPAANRRRRGIPASSPAARCPGRSPGSSRSRPVTSGPARPPPPRPGSARAGRRTARGTAAARREGFPDRPCGCPLRRARGRGRRRQTVRRVSRGRGGCPGGRRPEGLRGAASSVLREPGSRTRSGGGPRPTRTVRILGRCSWRAAGTGEVAASCRAPAVRPIPSPGLFRRRGRGAIEG